MSLLEAGETRWGGVNFMGTRRRLREGKVGKWVVHTASFLNAQNWTKMRRKKRDAWRSENEEEEDMKEEEEEEGGGKGRKWW